MKIYEKSVVTDLYKQLLLVLGEHCKQFPATGLDVYFQSALEGGKKVIPKDARAQLILSVILYGHSPAEAVSKLLNMRFSDFPLYCKPTYKKGRKIQCAFWCKKDRVMDRAKDLLNFDGTAGKWSDMDGGSVKILDM